MERKGKPKASLSQQIEKHAGEDPQSVDKMEGDTSTMVSTGSTLLDLAISGGRIRGGGVPFGILVEVFGPSGTGKTTLLCEIAGGVQRKNGEVMFNDPEGRLNRDFAKIFDFHADQAITSMPNTVPEVFEPIRSWNPQKPGPAAIFADSLAALSTDAELNDNDAYGMRRAKELSEECRKTCRIITQYNRLLVCSNQVRVNVNAGQFEEKYRSPGGEAIPFYSSLRLRVKNGGRIKKQKTIQSKKVERDIGVNALIEVYKSTVWKPRRSATVPIIFDYGIDDVRANLQFVKDFTNKTTYGIRDRGLHNSLEDAIAIVEKEGLEEELREETIDVWEDVESRFETERKPKRRD